jgi:putative transposase
MHKPSRKLSSIMPHNLIRYHHSGQFHFITFSCYQREAHFFNEHSFCVFEQEMEKARRRYGFVIARYVIMPEHVHLLVNEPTTAT